MNHPTSEPATQFARPRTRIVETASGYLAELELPGVSKDRLEITFEKGELAVVGRRQTVGGVDGAELLYRESRPVDFRRVFELNASIDASAIRATLDQGLLSLHLPKAESAKGRRIEVSGLN